MGSLDTGSFFTYITLEETVEIFNKELGKNMTLFMVWKNVDL